MTEPDSKTLYTVGGIFLIAVGLIYTLCTLTNYLPGMPSYGWASPPILSADAFINTLANHTRAAYANFGLFTFTDLLLPVAMLALYFALKDVNRIVVLVGIGFVIISVIFDAAAPIPAKPEEESRT